MNFFGPAIRTALLLIGVAVHEVRADQEVNASSLTFGRVPAEAFVGSARVLACADFNNDGRLDILFLADYGAIDLGRNLGGLTFTNALVFRGVYNAWPALGDYDNDTFVDVAVAGASSYPNSPYSLALLLHNERNGGFRSIHREEFGPSHGAASWGDFDNDGDLDLLGTISRSGLGRVSDLWANRGGGTFTAVLQNSRGVSENCIAWADIDRDGDLDFLLTWAGTEPFPYGPGLGLIYRNNGNRTFSRFDAGFVGVTEGAAAWGDYDADGYPDLVLCGLGPSNQPISRIYHNDRGNGFTDIEADLPGISECHFGFAVSSAAPAVGWLDYDGDGDSDLLLVGSTNGAPDGVVTRLYRNEGNHVFQETTANLPPATAAAWGDFDDDGALDLVLGDLTEGGAAYVYRNELGHSNRPPSACTELSSTFLAPNSVRLTWSPATDAETTNANGLTYSLRVGRTPGGSEVRSSDADPLTGFRRVPQPGNAGSANFAVLKYLPRGTYYWTVQAVDPGYAGSAFAPETSFTVTGILPPEAHGPGDLVLEEDARRQSNLFTNLHFGEGLPNLLSITARSDNPALITNLAVQYTPLQTTGQVAFSLVTNAFGAATIDVLFQATTASNEVVVTTNSFAVLVHPVNDRPVTSPYFVTNAEEQPVSIQLRASDVDGDPLTYIVPPPATGTLSGTPPDLVFTPATNFFGNAVIHFLANDGLTNSLPGAVFIVVTNVVDPIDGRLSFERQVNGAISLTLSGEPYQRYAIEVSYDLITWTMVGAGRMSGEGVLRVTDQMVGTVRELFYRARVYP